MLFLFLISFIFFWLIFREFRRPQKKDNFTWGYILVCLLLGMLAMMPMLRHWHFENFLETKAEMLTDGKNVDLTCTTALLSMFQRFGFAGTANPRTGKIVIQYPYCNHLRGYLKNPKRPTRYQLWSLNTFTHEAMHVRGEMNEAKTECQSIQRNHHAAMLLGVDQITAVKSAQRYYLYLYPMHGKKHYISSECAPGKKLDEKLPDAVWHRETKRVFRFPS